MSRYAVTFYKEGLMRFISHLDLLRLFKRSFKRAGIPLQHSQGFHPHPKMSFVQPLSLGYTSSCELLEFETVAKMRPEDVVEKLNYVLPQGVGISSCQELEPSGKSLAAAMNMAEYEIRIPLEGQNWPVSTENDDSNLTAVRDTALHDTIDGYKSQKSIIVEKKQKKKPGKVQEVDIQPLIHTIDGKVTDNHILLTIKVAAGSSANLSPELVLSSFCTFSQIPYLREAVDIRRTAIHFTQG